MMTNHLQIRLQNWLMRRTTNSAVRRVGELPLVVGTDIGILRNENQDRIAVLKMLRPGTSSSFLAVVLCDGMGGMHDGSTCASQAISCFLISCINNLNGELGASAIQAAQDANTAVYSRLEGRGGATLSAILIDSDRGIVGINIGDSRIYSFRNGVFDKLTTDDTIAGQLPESNQINAARRNELLQFIGVGDGLEPHIINVDRSNDYLVLTSDGLHYIDNNIIKMILQNAKDPAMAVRRLTELSKWCGGHDNASITVIHPIEIPSIPGEDNETIQIWDPFGELQIVSADSSNFKPFNNCIATTPTDNGVPIIVKKVPVRTKSTKTKKKASTTKNTLSQKHKNTQTESPQLVIDFNTKTSGDNND